jgi:hypothetical protein
MKLRTLAAATAVVTLAASPAIAETAFQRTAAPVKGENELGSGTLLAVLAAAAVIAGIIIAADGGSDDPVSP